MSVVPQSLDDLMTEFAGNLVNATDPVTGLPDPAQITDLNQGSKFKQYVQAIMVPIARIWSNLQDVSETSNIATATGEPLTLLVQALGYYPNTGSPSKGNVLAIPKASSNTGTLNAGDILIYNNASFVVLTSTTLASPYSVIPVQSANLGTQWNLPANTALVSGSDTLNSKFSFLVGNSLNAQGVPTGGLADGTDAATSDQIRSGFADYIKSLTRGVYKAVYQAALTIPGILSVALVEFAPLIGMMTLYIDDGSSNVTVDPTLSQTIQNTLIEWRAAGAGLVIQMMDKVLQACTINVVGAVDTDPVALQAQVEAALTTALNNYGYGQSFYPSNMVSIAFTVPNVVSASVVAPTVAEVTVGPNEVFRPLSVTANVTIASS